MTLERLLARCRATAQEAMGTDAYWEQHPISMLEEDLDAILRVKVRGGGRRDGWPAWTPRPSPIQADQLPPRCHAPFCSSRCAFGPPGNASSGWTAPHIQAHQPPPLRHQVRPPGRPPPPLRIQARQPHVRPLPYPTGASPPSQAGHDTHAAGILAHRGEKPEQNDPRLRREIRPQPAHACRPPGAPLVLPSVCLSLSPSLSPLSLLSLSSLLSSPLSLSLSHTHTHTQTHTHTLTHILSLTHHARHATIADEGQWPA